MCDTLVYHDEIKSSYFAKNSDRHPNELQLIQYTDFREKDLNPNNYKVRLKKYEDGPYAVLKEVIPKFENKYSAIISRPAWIWGAEMGINEVGVSIGNEAVFPKIKIEEKALLGMDILRLALHNSKTAKEALNFIIHIIETYKQGGDASYAGKSIKYCNSFLIKDDFDAYKLETAGKHWAYKKISKYDSISNSYSITGDYDKCDENSKGKNFKKEYENKIITFFAQGNLRRNYTFSHLKEKEINLAEIKAILRSHISPQNRKKNGMKSICMHSGKLIKSDTTASLIIDYKKGKRIIWFTASSYPCLSLFKPLVFTKDPQFFFNNYENSFKYCSENFELVKKINKDDRFFNKEIKPLRDELEKEFEKIIYSDIENKDNIQLAKDCLRCYELENEYKESIKKLLSGE